MARYTHALNYIQSCRHADVVLSGVWRVAPAAPMLLSQLAYASNGIRDRRIFDALAVTVRDTTRPLLVRYAALGTFAAYHQPASAIAAARFRPPAEGPFAGQCVESTGRIFDWADRPGEQSFEAAAVRGEIETVLAELARTGAPVEYRNASRCILRALQAHQQSKTGR